PLPVVQPKQTSAHSLAPESTRRQENTWRYLGTDPSHPERKFVALVDSLNLERGERLWRMQVGKAGRSRRWC
ncbi:hypothetical protein, partial [Bradyrhizobium liaoningense]|uniref:hypothetical protein n=1 Tax=Bradyrhizobium liaoningense TaxID=43992 RepID=UPI001BA46B39